MKMQFLATALLLAVGCGHASATVSHTEVAGSAICAPAELQTSFVVGDRGVESRTIERHRCGVAELKVVDRYDVSTASHVHEVFHDRDHDGRFEQHTTEQRPLRGGHADMANGRVAPHV